MIDAVNSVMDEGWDDMLKSVKDKKAPQPSGGEGKKQGSRYGGSKQKEEPKEKEIEEELKGNQSKIDANHNGKIDGQDFKILRGKKKVKTEGMDFANKLLNSLQEKKITEAELGDPLANREKLLQKHKASGQSPSGFLKRTIPASQTVRPGDLKNSPRNPRTDISRTGPKGKLPEGVELDEEQLDEMINEVLSKDATAGDWIHDFVHSDNPKFAGKSKAERKKMALGAYYAKNEEIEMKELSEEIVDLPINPLTGELEDDYELLVSGDAKELKKNQRMMIEEGTAQYKKKPSGKQMSDVVDRKKTVKDLVNRIRNPEYFGSGKVKGLDEVLQNADKPTSKEVRMATGIAKDPRYAGGNYSGAVKAMNKIKPNLSQHPAAQSALRKANEAVETSNDKNASKITTDTLAGRVPGGKLNSFKNFKTNLTTNGTDSIPTEIEKGEDTKEKQKITTNPGPVEVKLDDKLTGPTPYTHFVKKDKVTTEEVRGELKKIRNKEKELQKKDVAKFAKELGEEVELLDEDKWLSRFLLSKGINPNFINRNQKVSHAKSGEFHKWKRDHQSIRGSIQGESVVTPIKHTENLATLALKKIKNETMMGKAGATSESKKKW